MSTHNTEMNQKSQVSVTICLVHVNLYTLLYIKKKTTGNMLKLHCTNFFWKGYNYIKTAEHLQSGS
jgi:hypothetical protein